MTRGFVPVVFWLVVLLGIGIAFFSSAPAERLLAIRTFGLGFCAFGNLGELGILLLLPFDTK